MSVTPPLASPSMGVRVRVGWWGESAVKVGCHTKWDSKLKVTFLSHRVKYCCLASYDLLKLYFL